MRCAREGRAFCADGSLIRRRHGQCVIKEGVVFPPGQTSGAVGHTLPKDPLPGGTPPSGSKSARAASALQAQPGVSAKKPGAA